MDPFERDPRSGTRSGTQQTRDDSGLPRAGMGNLASSQGQFEQRQGKFMRTSPIFVALRLRRHHKLTCLSRLHRPVW